MASKDKKEMKKQRASGANSLYMLSAKRRLFFQSLKCVRKILGTIVVIAIIFFLLSGVINQVKTGETLVEYVIDVGKSLGEVFSGFPEGSGPFKWEDGIYFKNADVPDESAIDKDKLPEVPSGEDINNATDKASKAASDIMN